MKSLFGTDGIRGLAGQFPLDEKTVSTIGASLARHLTEKLGRSPRFVSGRDTRESGAAIEAAFLAGAASADAVCESAGVITTPGVAYLANAFGYDAGIVISASHNPFEDNGIKIFSPSGKKMDGATEKEIEKSIYAAGDRVASGDSPRPTDRSAEYARAYLDHLTEIASGVSAAGKKIVLDCANGAASRLAPQLFANTGAEIVAINVDPNGRNINANCGSLHLEHLQAKVLETGADLGVAFDGDADRALFSDETGTVVDGDATLWVLARNLKSHGKLSNSKVVSTVMSNIGLELAFESIGIELLRADVGDKYVLERLVETGTEIGGEQSGHIIFPEIGLVGDGMMTALLMLGAMIEKGVKLSEATDGFVRFPQTLKNVHVREKRPFDEVPEIAKAAKQVETELNGNGRLLLRYSGTENLARVMIEGKDQAAIEAKAQQLASVIGTALG